MTRANGWRRFEVVSAIVLCGAVAAGGAQGAGPVNVVHPPVPVIIPHPAPPPVPVVVPPPPMPHVVVPPPVPHVVLPAAPPPPVPHVVLPPPAPAPVAHVVPPAAPSPVPHVAVPAEPPPPVARTVVPPAAPPAAHVAVPDTPLPPTPDVAAVPAAAASVVGDPATTQRPAIRHPGRALPPRPAVLRAARVHPGPTPPRPAVTSAPAISTSHATSTVHAAAAEATARLPLPPTVRPDAPVTAAPQSQARAAIDGPTQSAAAPDRPAMAQMADPPASLAADPPATPTADTRRAPPPSAGLPPQPSGRLPLQPALLEALTAPIGFVSRPRAMVAPGAPRLAISNDESVTGVGVPLPAEGTADHGAFAPAAAALAHRAGALRRMFDSPMEFLREHLMPAAPSPFGLPRPFELRAPHTWPFAQADLQDNSVAIAAVVVAALVAMTALTSAGAGLSGRTLRHVAWRNGRRRLRTVSEWPTLLPDGIGDAAPASRVAAWPDRAAVAGADAESRERRVA